MADPKAKVARRRFKYAEFCQSCRKVMSSDDQIVYVEESSTRYFCSEKCIRTYYDPMADYYRKAHFAIRDAHDIPEADFTQYESYAPLTLNSPDEVWSETNEHGETFFFFLKSFMNEGGSFFYSVMCFCLELEPTYVLFAFPTRDKKMVEEYRRGKRVETTNLENEIESVAEPELGTHAEAELLSKQGNAIEEEMLKHRSKTDIDPKEFDDYAHLLEQAIESPDEVWEISDDHEHSLLTMILRGDDGMHYVVICSADPRAEEGQENWRVLYSFPTKDPDLVQIYRRGNLREGNSSGTTSFMQ